VRARVQACSSVADHSSFIRNQRAHRVSRSLSTRTTVHYGFVTESVPFSPSLSSCPVSVLHVGTDDINDLHRIASVCLAHCTALWKADTFAGYSISGRSPRRSPTLVLPFCPAFAFLRVPLTASSNLVSPRACYVPRISHESLAVCV